MLHPALRVPRIGFALILFAVCLGSASGAPAPDLASVEQRAAEQSAFTQSPTDSPAFVAGTIPCISGTCEVRIYAPAAPAPTTPLPRTTATPPALARR